MIRSRPNRFFFQTESSPTFIEFYNSIALRIPYLIGKDCCSGLRFRRIQKSVGQPVAIENIVTQDQSHGVLSDEFSSNDEGLRQTLWSRLYLILNAQTKMSAIVKEADKGLLVLGRGNDEDFSYTSQHQCGKRIVNHGLVIHGHELF